MFGFAKRKTPDTLALEAYPDLVKLYLQTSKELVAHGLKAEWATLDRGLYWNVALATEAAAHLVEQQVIDIAPFQRFRDVLINLAIKEVVDHICYARNPLMTPNNIAAEFQRYFPGLLRIYETVRDSHFDFAERIAVMREADPSAYFELISENGLRSICDYPGGDETPTPEGQRRFDAVIEVSKPNTGREVSRLQAGIKKLLLDNRKSMQG